MEQPIIANGGLQYVPQIAVQYVYLDFDGELTSYNGEILTVDNVEVQDSSLTEERIANIVAELNAKYADIPPSTLAKQKPLLPTATLPDWQKPLTRATKSQPTKPL
ncbi:MAG: hypothetical protein E7044_00425 [Lentisphaerae bacterium]|nr:hypothetical protein [Lentisphaerota bacterium]